MAVTIARRIGRSFLASVAPAVLVATLQSSTAFAGGEPALASVATGTLRGVVSDGIVAYKGIPYAAPPIGSGRWRAPGPALAWTGVRVADDYGPSCEQASAPERVPFDSRAGTMSEDCLTLNVWTPLLRPAALPVMVWVHGGGNTRGTGSDRFTDGTAFARDGIVLVTLNYRLGLLGFFAHPAFASEAGAAGTANFGLLDQIAALKWVRANIGAFGGDPANVTLFGESSGGEDTVLLATSDAAKGLFSRAIAESAAGLWDAFPTLAAAQTQGAKIVTSFGLSDDRATAAQLRAIPIERLAGAGDENGAGPIVDGRVIAGPLATAFEGRPRVPLIVGTNDDDGSLVAGIADPATIFPHLSHDAQATIRKSYGKRGITDDSAVARKLFGDGYFAAPARWEAARVTAAGQPAYLYRFDYVASVFGNRRPEATHGSEIPFVFETFTPSLLSDTDRAIEATVHGCWVAFARTGSTACPGASSWPPYDPHTGRQMVFDAQPSLRDPDDDGAIDILERELLPR
jgi:para-nitrobenzyl esterase